MDSITVEKVLNSNVNTFKEYIEHAFSKGVSYFLSYMSNILNKYSIFGINSNPRKGKSKYLYPSKWHSKVIDACLKLHVCAEFIDNLLLYKSMDEEIIANFLVFDTLKMQINFLQSKFEEHIGVYNYMITNIDPVIGVINIENLYGPGVDDNSNLSHPLDHLKNMPVDVKANNDKSILSNDIESSCNSSCIGLMDIEKSKFQVHSSHDIDLSIDKTENNELSNLSNDSSISCIDKISFGIPSSNDKLSFQESIVKNDSDNNTKVDNCSVNDEKTIKLNDYGDAAHNHGNDNPINNLLHDSNNISSKCSNGDSLIAGECKFIDSDINSSGFQRDVLYNADEYMLENPSLKIFGLQNNDSFIASNDICETFPSAYIDVLHNSSGNDELGNKFLNSEILSLTDKTDYLLTCSSLKTVEITGLNELPSNCSNNDWNMITSDISSGVDKSKVQKIDAEIKSPVNILCEGLVMLENDYNSALQEIDKERESSKVENHLHSNCCNITLIDSEFINSDYLFMTDKTDCVLFCSSLRADGKSDYTDLYLSDDRNIFQFIMKFSKMCFTTNSLLTNGLENIQHYMNKSLKIIHLLYLEKDDNSIKHDTSLVKIHHLSK